LKRSDPVQDRPCPGIPGFAGKAVRKKRRIIGIDPGLASTGWGVVEYAAGRVKYIAHGCIETGAQSPRAERLLCIYREINNVLDTWNPEEAAMESLYFGRNVTSAIAVAEARGVLSLALSERNLPLSEFTPHAIKQAVVGVHKARKEQVQEMVRLILGLPVIPAPDHAADALGAAVCLAHGS
jgi:crossover junction endodeoxyribonuclease RuvC